MELIVRLPKCGSYLLEQEAVLPHRKQYCHTGGSTATRRHDCDSTTTQEAVTTLLKRPLLAKKSKTKISDLA
jgi:hypothetical protein